MRGDTVFGFASAESVQLELASMLRCVGDHDCELRLGAVAMTPNMGS